MCSFDWLKFESPIGGSRSRGRWTSKQVWSQTFQKLVPVHIRRIREGVRAGSVSACITRALSYIYCTLVVLSQPAK